MESEGRTPATSASRSSRRCPDGGELIVNTVPWTTVFVDGVRIGNTPVRPCLSLGAHSILLRTADGREQVQEVQVEAGRHSLMLRL